jgi:hypothetical protein
MDQQDKSTTRRGVPIGVLLAISIVAIGLLFSWLRWREVSVPPQIHELAAAAPTMPGRNAELRRHLTDPAAVLTRRDLVTFVRLMGSTSADDRLRLEAAMVGRRFRAEVPMGCGATLPARPNASARWWYDPADQAIRLQALPEIWAGAEWRQIKSIDVFWITRPHGNSPNCAANQRDGNDTLRTKASPRIGLAAPSDAWGHRRVSTERNWYSSAVNATPAELPDIAPNLRLLLEGVVEGDIKDGMTVCSRGVRESTPDCALATHIDKVAFIDAKSGRSLAEWVAAADDQGRALP